MSSLDATQPLPQPLHHLPIILGESARHLNISFSIWTPNSSPCALDNFQYSSICIYPSSKELHFTQNSVLSPQRGVHFLLLSLLQPFLYLRFSCISGVGIFGFLLALSSKNLLTPSVGYCSLVHIFLQCPTIFFHTIRPVLSSNSTSNDRSWLASIFVYFN